VGWPDSQGNRVAARSASEGKDLLAVSLIGCTLGQYKVVAEVGRGQHSVVYKAWQPSLERHVALKVLHRHDPETLQNFQAEARLTAYLIGQGVSNIREVYEAGQTSDGYTFVALEYVADSLRSVLNRAREHKRRMHPEAAAKTLIPIAQALDAIHSLGWVHLDIKPQNILISTDGRALLADFGIAQRRGVLTHACTPTYASPEQAAGDRPVGPWSDIYSLGAVLYEMVAGHPPVRGDQDFVLLSQHLEATPPSPRRVNPQLSVSQERAIYKALAKSPKDRHRTASDLIEAMLSPETFLSSVAHRQTPVRMVKRTSIRPHQIPRLAVVGGLLVLLLAVLVGVVLLAWALWPRLPVDTQATTRSPAVATAETGIPTAILATGSPVATWSPTARPLPTATGTPTQVPSPVPTVTLATTGSPTGPTATGSVSP
jgi:serine/threonine protein kinase